MKKIRKKEIPNMKFLNHVKKSLDKNSRFMIIRDVDLGGLMKMNGIQMKECHHSLKNIQAIGAKKEV